MVQKDPDTEILHNYSHKILTQPFQKDPDTEILYKWSYRILIQVVQKDLHTEILRQRSCTSVTTGSWYKWSKRIRILKQRSCTSAPLDFDRVVQKILLQKSCAPTGSWHKRSKILIQRSSASVLQDPDTSGPKGSSYRDPETEISHKCYYRILIQVVQKDHNTEILRHRTCMIEVVLHNPDTQISHKCAYRILMQWSKRSCHRDLVQVLLQGPDTSGPKDPHIEILILHKLSNRILKGFRYTTPEGSWYRDLAEVVLEDPDTSGPKGSWYRHLVQVVIQRSWDRDLAQVPLQDPDASGPKG